MRDSNYRSISSNKAAVTITASLYDRRALDVTSDKPLVNSLNYLTYLVSSSAKVRETLATDGGIERLVDILHECHNFNHFSDDNGEKKLLTAWKWTLAFQCIVLVGTRGTEKIRQKVVKAGILPIIATVLDNYLSLHERSFLRMNTKPMDASNANASATTPVENVFRQHPEGQSESFLIQSIAHTQEARFRAPDPIVFDNQAAAIFPSQEFCSKHRVYPEDLNLASLTIDDYENSSVDQLFRLLRSAHFQFQDEDRGRRTPQPPAHGRGISIEQDVKRAFVVLNILNRLRETKEAEALEPGFVSDCEYEMDSNLTFLSNLYSRDFEINSTSNSKLAVREFTETGVVIPKDDDIVWSLQLLAYISKYPNLKDILQNTHLVLDMSIRDKSFKVFVENQMKLKMKMKMKSKKNAAVRLRPTITPKTRKPKTTYVERFSPSASNSPQMVTALNDDNLILSDEQFALCDSGIPEEGQRGGSNSVRDAVVYSAVGEAEDEEAEDEDEDDDEDDGDEGDDEKQQQQEDDDDTDDFEETISDSSGSVASDSVRSSTNYMSKLHHWITMYETITDEFERSVRMYQLMDKLNKFIEMESMNLSSTIIETRLKTKAYLQEKWNYDTYQYFNVDDCDEDKDDSLTEHKRVNLFPIVEKFTFLSGSDMYYWSGVIMRNSCRRNDLKGGVRQCGNLECGKWEKYPREFSKCRRCKRTKYCSRDCQMRAWHCHRNWCIPSTSSSNTTSNSSLHTQSLGGVTGVATTAGGGNATAAAGAAGGTAGGGAVFTGGGATTANLEDSVGQLDSEALAEDGNDGNESPSESA
ncbi:uncharacterized protein LODBEIA_P34880 [Lodderomyces beijingensis]|uniref:MYND-type domain-containing protein n=1 Tax=Lodderomyces beijingensis TaxID=1775926 RepID=A0ABP0ZM98_9ASCO